MAGAWDAAVASLAAAQRGVVARRQLLKLGMSRARVDERVRSGRLHPLHRGVYLVGHKVPPEGAREMAAALACGPRASVSHRSAATLWALAPSLPNTAPVHVTVHNGSHRARPGIRVHRIALPRSDRRSLDGVPVTSATRTIVDLAVARDPCLESAAARALRRGLAGRDELVERARATRGCRSLMRLLDAGPALTESEAEARFLKLVRRAHLPMPECNVPLGRFVVDFLWRDESLIVEIDGFAFHSDRSTFESDRVRDAELQLAGFRVLRFTWRMLVDQPQAVVARLARALGNS